MDEIEKHLKSLQELMHFYFLELNYYETDLINLISIILGFENKGIQLQKPIITDEIINSPFFLPLLNGIQENNDEFEYFNEESNKLYKEFEKYKKYNLSNLNLEKTIEKAIFLKKLGKRLSLNNTKNKLYFYVRKNIFENIIIKNKDILSLIKDLDEKIRGNNSNKLPLIKQHENDKKFIQQSYPILCNTLLQNNKTTLLKDLVIVKEIIFIPKDNELYSCIDIHCFDTGLFLFKNPKPIMGTKLKNKKWILLQPNDLIYYHKNISCIPACVLVEEQPNIILMEVSNKLIAMESVGYNPYFLTAILNNYYMKNIFGKMYLDNKNISVLLEMPITIFNKDFEAFFENLMKNILYYHATFYNIREIKLNLDAVLIKQGPIAATFYYNHILKNKNSI